MNKTEMKLTNSIMNNSAYTVHQLGDEPLRTKNRLFFSGIKDKLFKMLKKANENRKYQITAFILSVLSIILYFLGLEGCYGDEVYCLARLGIIFYLKIIILNSVSCLCLCTVLILMTFGKVIILHLLYLLPSLILMMLFDHGTTLAHHGYYNTLGYIALLIILYPLCSFIYLMIKLIKEKRFKIYIPILLIILILVILFYSFIYGKTKCNEWDLGLNNTRIYNNEDEYACQIKLPKKCYLNVVDKKLNVSNIIKKDCAKRDDSEKKMLFEYIRRSNNSYITPFTKRIGYPNINKGDYPQEKQDGLIKLSREIVRDLVDMDHLPSHITPEKIPEIYIDFTNYPEEPDSKFGKIHINLMKNESLIEERKKNAENNEVIFNNIILIFVDTVSRAHINRKMPKFKSWVERYMKYESQDFKGYQFLKFHSLGVHTHLNFKPIIYGESVLSANGINILHYLKEKGFITAQADNYCSPEPYQLHPTFDHSNVTYEYFDHELISLFCDPNFFRPENPFPIHKGNCGIIRRCLYGYDTFHYLLEYSNLFWKTYKGNRRFLRLSSMDSHEATGELVSLFDEPLTNFLDNLYQNGDLNDTVLFLFSDHGNHMALHLTLLPADDLEIEKIMPFFFIILPKKSENYKNLNFLDEYYENLYKNQQSFVTSYDIHDTIINIIFNESEKNKAPFSINGTSLFLTVDNKHRTCEDFPEIFAKKSPGTLTCNCINNNIQ
jgi:hypothetical protein